MVAKKDAFLQPNPLQLLLQPVTYRCIMSLLTTLLLYNLFARFRQNTPIVSNTYNGQNNRTHSKTIEINKPNLINSSLNYKN